MQIPHEVSARPDTGLYNAKLGIWLFLASEVMLFGGLFSAYVFLRVGADDGYWPHGLPAPERAGGHLQYGVLIISSGDGGAGLGVAEDAPVDSGIQRYM